MLRHSEETSGDQRAQHIFRTLVEHVASLLWREPVTLVTTQQFDRLRQLERRESLLIAERSGNQQFLDQELARVQLTQADLVRGKEHLTPIAQWPDEDFDGVFDPNPNTQLAADPSSGPVASISPASR